MKFVALPFLSLEEAIEQRRKLGDSETFLASRRGWGLGIEEFRQETTMLWAWTAEQLAMGAAGHAANRVRDKK